MTGYLPGDPRYGLSGEALRNYYRTKPAQWAIYCWDKPGTAETRRGLLQDQKSYVKNFGERVIGYGHFVSDDGRDTLGTSFFMQLDDRAAADAFGAFWVDEPSDDWLGRHEIDRSAKLEILTGQSRGEKRVAARGIYVAHTVQILNRGKPDELSSFEAVRPFESNELVSLNLLRTGDTP
jgi:hypothetical protein